VDISFLSYPHVKAMEFDSNKEISDNVGVDSEVQKSGRQKRKPAWLADYETY
jgi:hypothetical protein